MITTLASLTFDNAEPAWFWWLVIIGAVVSLVVTYRRIYVRSRRRLTWTLCAARVVGVLAIVLAIVKPAWISRSEHAQKPILAVIVDDSQSMTHPAPVGDGALDQPDASRYHMMRSWLTASQTSNELRNRFDLRLFNVAGDQFDSVGDLPKQANAPHTDLVRALHVARDALRGRHVAAALLISDGHDTTGRDSFMVIQQFDRPVYALGFSRRVASIASDHGADLRVISVDAPPRAMVHNGVTVQVHVSKDGGPAVTAPLQIKHDHRVLHTRTVELPAGAARLPVAMTFTPDEPGDFVLAARMTPQAGEPTAINNTALFRLRIDADPIRVLYVEGTLRSEYAYLSRRLKQDPDIDLITFVRSAGGHGAAVQGALIGGELFMPDRLEKIDVVLLGDFEARMLGTHTYDQLHDWIESGGGLMVLGGYRNLTPGGLWQTALAKALPVDPPADAGSIVTQFEKPFTFALTGEGLRHSALQMSSSRSRDARAWSTLPQLRGIARVGAPRLGATVLATHPTATFIQPNQGSAVVLATQRYGSGVVAILTADTTWRWSRHARLAGRPDTMYVRFWSQMIRWLARRDVQDDVAALAVSTDAPSYGTGQRVTVRVTRHPTVLLPGANDDEQRVHVQVRTPADESINVPVTVSPTDDNQWVGAFFPDQGGRFSVHARLIASPRPDARVLANQVSEFLVQGSRLELEDPQPNPATLDRIARLTGGVHADLNDRDAIEHMVEKIPDEPHVSVRVRAARFWNHPMLFVLFVVLLSGEWIARRRNQLT